MTAQDDKTRSDEPAQARKKFHELVRSFDLAMLVTQSHDGSSHGRPMGVAGIDADDTLWFNARIDSAKVSELQHEPRALIVMQGSMKQLTVNGAAEITRDRAKIEELWSESWKVYFQGKDDPQLALIRFTPENAEYWDSSGVEGIKYVLKAAKAYLSGKPLSDTNDPESHGRIQV